jgi:hypothetical protein
MPAHDQPTPLARQKKKLWLFGAMFAAAGIGLLFTNEIAQLLGTAAASVRLATLLLTFSALVAAFLTIRCKHCGLSLVLHAMSHKDVGGWLPWLLTVKTCPRCGQPHGVKEHKESHTS